MKPDHLPALPSSGHAIDAIGRVAAVSEVLSPAARAERRTDADLMEQFLRERCNRSVNTEMSYRSHLRRLGWFCQLQGLRSVREFRREHWPAFSDYLRSPPADHIMDRVYRYEDPHWRPFRGALAHGSVAVAQTVVRAFFAWMADPAIAAIQVDPVGSVRNHSERVAASEAGIDRVLLMQDHPYVASALEEMPHDTPTHVLAKARCQWVIALALSTGLRAGEIASARRRDLVRGAEPGTYLLSVLRKGKLRSRIPLDDDVVRQWRAYVQHYPTIADGDDVPLVLPVRAHLLKPPIASTSRQRVWRIVTEVMHAAADKACEAGDAEADARLRSTSTHWLRHSFATDLLRSGADIVAARDLLDHASVTTTNKYLHTHEDDMRQAKAKLTAYRAGSPLTKLR